jgi:hypothetical protein
MSSHRNFLSCASLIMVVSDSILPRFSLEGKIEQFKRSQVDNRPNYGDTPPSIKLGGAFYSLAVMEPWLWISRPLIPSFKDKADSVD